LFVHACGDECSGNSLPYARLCAADSTIDTSRGPTWRAGETDADSSLDYEGDASASLAGGCAVHAGYDYASRAGG